MIARVGLLIFAVALLAGPALAQRAEPVAVRRMSIDTRSTRSRSAAPRSLGEDMKRGAVYGAITGAVLSGIAVIAIRSSSCSTAEAPCSHLGNGQSAAVICGGAAAGALIGAILGYTYHTGQNDSVRSGDRGEGQAQRR